jgi:excisionase family DNA binding protein
VRRVNGIHAYRSAEKDGAWLTMSEAAAALQVSNHTVRRLIKEQVLAAEQVVPGAPWQIRASDLEHERVIAAIGRTSRPCRENLEGQLSMFSNS